MRNEAGRFETGPYDLPFANYDVIFCNEEIATGRLPSLAITRPGEYFRPFGIPPRISFALAYTRPVAPTSFFLWEDGKGSAPRTCRNQCS